MSPGLVNSCHAVHLHLQTLKKPLRVTKCSDIFMCLYEVPLLCPTIQKTELWRPAVWSASCADTRTRTTELRLCCSISPVEIDHCYLIQTHFCNTKWEFHVLTHWTLFGDFFSTGFPTEPFGRSSSNLFTYNKWPGCRPQCFNETLIAIIYWQLFFKGQYCDSLYFIFKWLFPVPPCLGPQRTLLLCPVLWALVYSA